MKQPSLSRGSYVGGLISSTRQRCLGFCAIVWILVAGTEGLTPSLRAQQSPPEYPEYQVKASYLLNFTRYIDWPTRSFKSTNSPMVIGVLGQDRFGDDLRTLVQGKRVEGHDLVVRRIETLEQCRDTQILFISSSEKRRIPDIVQSLKGAPVLTVGETDGFIQSGGIINFRLRNKDLFVDINRPAADKVGLRISARLLQVIEKGKVAK